MIAYLPELYKGELVYSWFARYFAHMYPLYTCAVEDFLESRNMRADMEFLNRLNAEARVAITKMLSLDELVLKHTMFPYCRFADSSRLSKALHSMVAMEGDVHQLLPLPKGHPAMNSIKMIYTFLSKKAIIQGIWVNCNIEMEIMQMGEGKRRVGFC